MQVETTQSRTSRIIDEFLLFDAIDDVVDDAVEDLDDELLSSAGGPYHWVPEEL
ncbi:MAG: hypothetical protein K2Y35_21065 [Burkholderiales bacterium]|nr:hypothetical protein [Burkholderiales bacterium]